MRTMKRLQEAIYENAVEKGFYDPPRSYGESIALMHSELSEALEEGRDHPDDLGRVYFRHTNPFDGTEVIFDSYIVVHEMPGKQSETTYGKPEGFGVELADCVIRILDTAEYLGLDMQELIELKMSYNATRSHKHGGKHI